MPASASLSALALGEGDVEGEWRHSQETRFHCRETRSSERLQRRPLRYEYDWLRRNDKDMATLAWELDAARRGLWFR